MTKQTNMFAEMTKRTMITIFWLSTIILIPLTIDQIVQGNHRIILPIVILYIMATIGLRKGVRANATEVTEKKN